MEEPIRVLHVLGSTNLGGAESRIMELYRCIDRSQIQFDFLVHTQQDGYYSEEIRSLGGRIYSLPKFKLVNWLDYKDAIRLFFTEHQEFVAVHGHMTSTASIYLPIAKQMYDKNGKCLLAIAHARSAGVDKGLKGVITKWIRSSLKRKADYCFTCSKEAGIAVYGKQWIESGKVWTIPNAIDVSRFAYNEEKRCEVRAQLGLQDCFVIGHVGRFGFMKNHVYMVDILAELCKAREDIRMVFIGEGEEQATVRERVASLKLEDKVLFLGNKKDVESYYQAFDYFIFPSMFEGLPGSVVEAQASGLHCLVSDTVTREVGLTKLVTYRSIQEPPKIWAEEILKNATEALVRTDVQDILCKAGFDVRIQSKTMLEFYKSGENPPGCVTRL